MPLEGIRPHLDVRLEDGWRWDDKRGAFRTTAGETCEMGKMLPEGTVIRPTVEALAKADPKKLTPEERDLAHFVQIVLPKGADLAAVADTIGELPCVQSAKPGPKISLP